MNNHNQAILLLSLLICGSILGMQEKVKRQLEEESTEFSKKARAETEEETQAEALNSKLNPHELDAERMTALHHAACEGDIAAIQHLVQQGVKLEDIDKQGKTALSYAAQNGHLAAIRCLIQLGANRDASAGLPFYLALAYNKLDAMRVLFELGALAFPEGWTWLHRAAAGGHITAIPTLIELGIPINKAIESVGVSNRIPIAPIRQGDFEQRYGGAACGLSIGNTPLHCAASVAVMKLLIDAGANLEAHNNIGQTPLHICISSTTAIRYLVTKGANVNAVDLLQGTPLHFAVLVANRDIMRYLNVIECLIELGANKELRDYRGRTPLQCAIDERGSDDNLVRLISLLVKRGCDIEVKDHLGDTPINRILLQTSANPTEKRNKIFRLYLLGAHIGNFGHRDPDDSTVKIIRKLENTLNKGNSANLQALLFTYAGNGSTDLIHKLFTDERSKGKIDVDAKSAKGQTALLRAFLGCHLELVHALLYKYRVNFTIKDNKGRTIKDWANKEGAHSGILKPYILLFERKLVAVLALSQTKTRPNNPLPKEIAFKIVRMVN